LPSSPFFTSADEGHLIEGWIKDWMPEIQIDEQTCVAKWYAGDKMDWDIAVGNLFH
jgi:hypothetical protein